uniref:Uncharacterized protein n=1 Tax=viral metagenome TaxID=1070528 RepID=A0A6M3IZL8_9ZZZZ
MQLGEILTKVGSTVLKNVIPGAGIVIDLVNEFLPNDKKLPGTATGADIKGAVDSLPPEQRNQLMMKELDVEIKQEEEFTKRFEVLAKADESGSTTRPQIALMMSQATCFAIVAFISFVCIAIYNDKWATIDKLSNSWELITVILGIPSALLRSYFAMRNDEKKTRYQMAGAPKSAGVLADLVSAFKK